MKPIITTLKNKVRTIILNKPKKKNALSQNEIIQLTKILQRDAENEDVVITILTGAGDYFCSGSDFKVLSEKSSKKNENEEDQELNRAFCDLVHTLIDYPKLLIAVVNGPCVGVGCTMLNLCDVIYASDKATFLTPFILYNLCCECCSSFLLPLTMGRSKASEMILLGKKITAQEAEKSGFVSKVFPHERLETFIEDLHQHGDLLPIKGLKINKKLMVDNFRTSLHVCNDRECNELKKIPSSDFVNALMKIKNKKSKM